MAAVLRQLVCNLCGDSGGVQSARLLCCVSSHGAALGSRQRRHDRESVALTPLLFFPILLFYFSIKQFRCQTLESCSSTLCLHSCAVYCSKASILYLASLRIKPTGSIHDKLHRSGLLFVRCVTRRCRLVKINWSAINAF